MRIEKERGDARRRGEATERNVLQTEIIMRGASAFNHDIKHLRSLRRCPATLRLASLLFSCGPDPILPLIQSDFCCNPPASLVYVYTAYIADNLIRWSISPRDILSTEFNLECVLACHERDVNIHLGSLQSLFNHVYHYIISINYYYANLFNELCSFIL